MEQFEGLSEAVAEGREPGLIALRDLLARSLEQCESSRDVAPLVLRLTDVLSQLEELSGSGSGESPVDEIAARRRARSA